MTQKPQTLGDLSRSDHAPLSVRDEVRRNLQRKLRAGERLFPGVVGYDDSVIPQVVNALLARHDLILLGLRGQAKTRISRQLVDLLDPEVPVVPGCPLRSHPLAPLGRYAERRVAEEGNAMPIEWLPREARYGEKLATPDVTMADLIGDLDPLKAAHRKLDLSDDEAVSFGIVPRSNRGIFNLNEIPDLAPRIQVGLLNLLEERDVQIRGFPIRIPLDVLMVFTANPEDYTNRGSIITPLKDRIASQILTHYPRTVAEARQITEAEAWLERGPAATPVSLPDFLAQVVEEIAFQGRASEYVDQTSGISARLSIAARELLASQVEQRVLRVPGTRPVARLVDLGQLVPAVTGKIELVYEGEQEGTTKVARHLIASACRAAFDRAFPDAMSDDPKPPAKSLARPPQKTGEVYKPILDWFAAGNRLEISDRSPDEAYLNTLEMVPGLAELGREFCPQDFEQAPGAVMELILEGLHQHSLLAKEDVATGTSYSDMLGIMLEGLR
ncbi:MAG: sigma 54-interacting transcriptional regulator [Planctomycetota bacterium]